MWELYAPDDWTQANNIAAQNPAKLNELQQLFLLKGAKYHVFPLDDRRVERLNSDMAGRPDLVAGRTTMTLYPGMGHINVNQHRTGTPLAIGANTFIQWHYQRFGGVPIGADQDLPVQRILDVESRQQPPLERGLGSVLIHTVALSHCRTHKCRRCVSASRGDPTHKQVLRTPGQRRRIAIAIASNPTFAPGSPSRPR